MTVLSAQQIRQLAVNAGFKGSSVDTITAIALAESSGNTQAFNRNDPHGGSFGLTQINGIHPDAQAAFDPQTALNKAYDISGGGTNFRPWSTYTSGAYQRYVPIAQASGDISSALNSNGTSLTFDPASEPASITNTVDNSMTGGGSSVVDFSGIDPSQFNSNSSDALGDFSPRSDAPGLSTVTDLAGNVIGNAIGGATAGSQTSFYDWAVGVTGDFFMRWGVFLIGFAMLAAAVWAFAREGEGAHA